MALHQIMLDLFCFGPGLQLSGVLDDEEKAADLS
jgi:hypothetical protein